MSPFLTPAEAADLLRFPSADALNLWAKRNHVPFIASRTGRKKLFERDVLLAAFTSSIDRQPARMPPMSASLTNRATQFPCARRRAS